MTDTPTSQGTDPAPPAEPTGTTEQRLDSLEDHQQTLDEKIDELLGLIRGKGRGSEPSGPRDGGASGDSPTGASVAEQVQAELSRRDQAAAEQADQESLKERLARLEEQPPAPPVRRATKMLGWGAGR